VDGSAGMLLDQARNYVSAESDRATGVQTRATAVVATSGVVLGLTISIAKDLFARDVPTTEFRWIFVGTLGVLFLAALLSGIALWPPGSAAAPIEEIEDYVLPENLDRAERATAPALLSSLSAELASIRDSNDGKSRLLRCGMALLVLGAFGAAVQGAAIGLSDPKKKHASTTLGQSATIHTEQPSNKSDGRR
jgi:hypothetical protein